MVILIWRGLVTTKFSVPPRGKIMCQIPKRFRSARTCSRSSITMPSLVGLEFHPPPGWRKALSFVCLSRFFCPSHFVCPSRFWTSRVCSPDFTMKALEYRNDLMPLDRGRFVVVHLCSTFSDCRQLSISLNAEVQKTQKWVFRHRRAIE